MKDRQASQSSPTKPARAVLRSQRARGGARGSLGLRLGATYYAYAAARRPPAVTVRPSPLVGAPKQARCWARVERSAWRWVGLGCADGHTRPALLITAHSRSSRIMQ